MPVIIQWMGANDLLLCISRIPASLVLLSHFYLLSHQLVLSSRRVPTDRENQGKIKLKLQVWKIREFEKSWTISGKVREFDKR